MYVSHQKHKHKISQARPGLSLGGPGLDNCEQPTSSNIFPYPFICTLYHRTPRGLAFGLTMHLFTFMRAPHACKLINLCTLIKARYRTSGFACAINSINLVFPPRSATVFFALSLSLACLMNCPISLAEIVRVSGSDEVFKSSTRRLERGSRVSC